jgi:hypothetical protein
MAIMASHQPATLVATLEDLGIFIVLFSWRERAKLLCLPSLFAPGKLSLAEGIVSK